MTGVLKTKNKIDTAISKNQARLFIVRSGDAKMATHVQWNIKTMHEIYWKKYQIKETDMRVKTATFTSDTYLDLSTGTYCVLITSPQHEDFGGVILSVEKDKDTGLYNYQCQDFTRFYIGRLDGVVRGVSLHRLIKFCLTLGHYPLHGDGSAVQKNWKNTLSGLRPAYQYDLESWGSIVKGNPMTQSINAVIKGKTFIEVIRDFVFGTGLYCDVYPNKYGIIQIEPYHKDDWLKSCVEIPLHAISDMKVGFDTTNIITGVDVQSTEQLASGNAYQSTELIGLNLASIFGNRGASISNPNQGSTSKGGTVSNTSKKNTSSSSAKKTSGNPYGTKKKRIYLNTDNIHGKSTDKKFLTDIANKLKKQGWSTKIIGVGPNTHTEKYMKGCSDGVWFCVYGGADGAVFKECAGKNSYTNTLKKNNLRTVIGMRQGCDIRKGGKCYKYLKRAHDDNYSPASYKGVSYPLNMLTKAKVPIMYASTVDKMVAKFLKGGDNPSAC